MPIANSLARVLIRYSDFRTIENTIAVVTCYDVYDIVTSRLPNHISFVGKISLTLYTACVYWGLIKNRKYSDIGKVTLKYLFIISHM